MVLKIADEYRLQVESNTEENRNLVVVREYCEERDKVSVEKMERQCDVGQKGKPSIFTDLLGDPICRVRHFPSHVMLVNTIYIHTYILPSTSQNDTFICMSFKWYVLNRIYIYIGSFLLGYFNFSFGFFSGIV